MRYLFLIAPILVSCGPRIVRDVNISILPYVERFEAIYGQPIAYSVGFTDEIDNNWVGVCYSWADGRRKVEINGEYWAVIDDATREELIFHELGHCTLNRGHREDKIEYEGIQIPISIMFPYIFSDISWYTERRNEYINELFNKTNSIRTLLNTGKDIVVYD